MKKTIAIIITLSILLTGCSSSKKSVANEDNKSNDTKNNSQLDSNSQNSIDTSLLDNIDTTNSPFKKGYYNYSGSINNNLGIQMSIYPLDKDIVGSYFYDSKKIEIKLKGKAGDKSFVLYEYDESGKNTGVFKGTMTTVDKIEGTWLSPDGTQSYPFTLSLNSSLPGSEYGKRYSACGVTQSDEVVESFASEIQGYIVSDNKKKLADNISYPISLNINGTITKIQSKDEFIKNYDKIINSDFKKSLSNASTKYLFANSQGIMFGEGSYNLWINESNSKLIITSINNGNSLASTDSISEKVKNYINNGQGDKSSAEKIKWSKAFLDKVDIESLYKSYIAKGGSADDIENFSIYMTKNAPIPSDWKDLFEKDLLNLYGCTVARLESLKDYPDYYQAYVIIDGSEKPYVVVSSRTGDFHG